MVIIHQTYLAVAGYVVPGWEWHRSEVCLLAGCDRTDDYPNPFGWEVDVFWFYDDGVAMFAVTEAYEDVYGKEGACVAFGYLKLHADPANDWLKEFVLRSELQRKGFYLP